MDRRDLQKRSEPTTRRVGAPVDTGLIGEFIELGAEVRADLAELGADVVELGAELRTELTDLGREVRVETRVVRARWKRALRIHLTPARRRRLAAAALNVAIAAGVAAAVLMAFVR